MFVFRYESLLEAAEPVPLYALKLLVSMTEYSKLMCRYSTHTHTVMVFFKRKRQSYHITDNAS